jgi:hypothetical protein
MQLLEKAEAARLLKTYDQKRISVKKIYVMMNIDMGKLVHH